MVQSKATSVKGYLAELEPGLRKEIETVRKVILKHLPKGYVEQVDFGMLAYVVPLETYPDTYNGHPLPIAGLAAQKNYNSVYLMAVYADAGTQKWFDDAYKASGKRLDMGKSCVRFKRAADLALDVIGKAVERVSVEAFIARAEASRKTRR
ncbi:MAG TPA: DUF1801 domain-containing protein [Candidatus Thermoplasmatota archaeon]